MRKKLFSLVAIFFALSLVCAFVLLAYTIYTVRSFNVFLYEIQLELASSTAKDVVHNDNDQRLFEQCYAEIVWQNGQMNLLYCAELEHPVIRAVASNNWNLIEDAFICNTSSKEDLDVIEVSPCVYYAKITEFSYFPTDDISSEAENPPESGWTEISPNENGNYLLPLKEGEEINGSYYTLFRYVINDDTYYGLFCLSTIF